jgi:SAM-dependent methyltransferase
MGRKKKKKYSADTADRHALYEEAVQCVEADIDFLDSVFKERRGRVPHTLKEDFCGTAAASAEFVRRRRENRAWGVDLSAETLEWGRERHVASLGGRASDVTLLHANVLDIREPLVDVVAAMNFSYFIFKRRRELLAYFENCLASLKPGGMLVLDAYGGYEAQVVLKEKSKKDGFTYVWDQNRYNPITNEVCNIIHFHFPDGSRMKDAFVYDWRLWTLREITEALEEAGFSRAEVYWEGWDEKEECGDGNFTLAESADNCAGWIVYIVAWR